MRHVVVRYAFLLSLLLAACGGSDDGTPRSDDGVERPLGETEVLTWADPLFHIGKAWALKLDGNTIREHCAAPPTNPLICSQLPDYITDSTAATLVFGLVGKGNDQWEAVLQWQYTDDDLWSEVEVASEAVWEEGGFNLLFTQSQWVINGLAFDVLEVEATGQHKARQSDLQLDQLGILLDTGMDICPVECVATIELFLSNLVLAPLPGGL